ncbi:MAG: hypothetical protein ACKPCC_23195, partial [Dolichospermum sp.]
IVLVYWLMIFCSRKVAKSQRVILSVYEIVLPYQVQDITFLMRCQWFYYLFFGDVFKVLRVNVLLFWFIG